MLYYQDFDFLVTLLGLLLQINNFFFVSSNPAIPLSKQFHMSKEITFVYNSILQRWFYGTSIEN